MTEKKDAYGKVKKEMRLGERILGAIPGFHGYKEKELRRESDRLLRNSLYERLSQAKSDTRFVFQKLSDKRVFEVLNDMDRLVAKFDRVAEKVNHASYGYAGFFDAVKVAEEALDRMINFDNEMFDDVDSITKEAAGFKAEVTKMDFTTAAERTQHLTDTLDAFEQAFDKRQEVILGVN